MERKIADDLLKWGQTPDSLPLLVYGARQVGKTYSIREFGKENYEKVVEINFEDEPAISAFFKHSLKPAEIIKHLEDYTHQKIDQEKTLIFFDEIQKCPPALTSLKYFADEIEHGVSRYRIVSAGSLLGVTTKREQKSEKSTQPVGKTEQLFVYPMDFEEFLWACDKKWLAQEIRKHFTGNQTLDDVWHAMALDYYQKFLVVGGMPRVVKQYLQSSDYRSAQSSIINDYIADISKHTEAVMGMRTIDTYVSIPAQLGREEKNKKFVYSRIKKGARSDDYSDSIIWLIQAKLAICAFKTQIGNQPPGSTEDKSSFKLYLSDTGLLCNQLQVDLNNLGVYDNKSWGAITENYVACALQNTHKTLYRTLNYWKSSERAESSEVDFLISTSAGATPIEVKSGLNTKSQSLNAFIGKYHPALAYRVSAKNFGYFPKSNLKAIPLYAVFCIN